MQDGDAIPDVGKRFERIDADAQQMRRIEFQAEAGALDPCEKLLPSVGRRADEIVLRAGPVLDRKCQAARIGRRNQRVGVVCETVVILLLAHLVVPTGKDDENRNLRLADRMRELQRFGRAARPGGRASASS